MICSEFTRIAESASFGSQSAQLQLQPDFPNRDEASSFLVKMLSFAILLTLLNAVGAYDVLMVAGRYGDGLRHLSPKKLIKCRPNRGAGILENLFVNFEKCKLCETTLLRNPVLLGQIHFTILGGYYHENGGDQFLRYEH